MQYADKSPRPLDQDQVAFDYREKPDDEAKYKVKLPSLYSNEPLQM